MKKLVAFDLDDTLAVTKSPVSPEMATLLSALLERFEVCIISGGRLEQFQAQVLAHLDSPHLSRLHLMPTCGTRYYRYAEEWTLQYAEDLTSSEKDAALSSLGRRAKELSLWEEETWGPILEDRGSQVTFSALGQAAPPEAKYAWDPSGTKKEALRAAVQADLPALEVKSGGTTSVDITRRGVDKAYGMTRLMEILSLTKEDVLFVGDRLDEGGNDAPVKDMGISCVAVDSPHDTQLVITTLLAL